MNCRIVWTGLLLALLVGLVPAKAQEAGDGTMHVLRPVLHAEQDEAELCLEFDHDLEASDHGKTASAVRLEAGGKSVPVGAQNISIAANLLCLPSLDYRREYRIAVTGIRGAKGEKLAAPYSLGFTVPDRQPSLAFTGGASGLMRLEDGDPVLRSLNVARVHVELYRVNDPVSMAEAWRNRQQTTLAPSESATFGHDHGQSVWSSDITLGDAPNRILEQPVPLHASIGNLSPGLYLIVARAPEKTKTEQETEGLAATGAAWILHSVLRLHAMRDPQGFYVFTENAAASASLKNVRLLIEDPGGQTLGEIRSGDDGVGFLPLPPDKKNAASLIMGLTDQGDADFADLADRVVDRFAVPKNEMTIALDKAFYAPDAPVSVTLTGRDTQGHPVSGPNTVLQLLRAGGGFYAAFPVSSDATGVAHLTFPAPATGSVWSLVWQNADGGALSQTSLRVTANKDAPRIDMAADRAVLPGDGAVNLTLKSVANDGKPEPYTPGRIFVAWAAADTIFHEWDDYRFGNGGHPPGEAMPVVSFITDEKGIAHIKLNLAPPSDDRATLHSAVLSVRSDAATGIADPAAPLTLPLKPRDDIVGIRPFAPDGRFPENGLAQFTVIALNADGHRRGMDGLTWQVYEEGRSFDWYQAEGRWNYKPLQQKRRMGGGTLTLTPDGDGIIEWPVTAGAYRLEITDTNGTLRAASDFGAGWDLPGATTPAPLSLTPPSAPLQPGQEARIRFMLDHPSMITAFIGDDHVRKVIHEFRPQGENVIAFTPAGDWGSPVAVRVEVTASNLAGQTTLPLTKESKEEAKSETPKTMPPADALTIEGDFPDGLSVGDSARLTIDLKNNGANASYRATITASSGLKLGDMVSGAVDLAAGQSKRIPFTLVALHPGPATIKLEMTGPAHFHMTRDWDMPVVAGNAKLGVIAEQKLDPQQSWSSALAEKPHAKTAEDNTAFLAAEPLFGTPAFLADILNANPFTTAEIAGMLETMRLWRETILEAGLMPGAALEKRRQDILLRLLARQKSDGGFPSVPGSEADLDSTSQALTALSRITSKTSRPATEQAANWLRHLLENTWFDEKERSDRAAAYAALAAAERVDNASLHYFSDTSADKKLPPLAAAQLAMAFSRTGDTGKASFWLDASGARSGMANMPPALLPVLAENPGFDPHMLLASLETLSASLSKNPGSPVESMTAFLRASWFLQDRHGNWRVTVNTDKRNPKGVLVIALPAKASPQTIHNTDSAPLFLARAQKPVIPSAGISRHIYQLNGTEIGQRAPLIHDETYLVILEGLWPAGDASQPIALHDDPAPGLHVTGCLPPPPVEADDSLAWLKSQALTPLSSCEIWNGGVDMLVMHKDSSGPAWRAAYLAKAEWAGNFILSSAAARSLGARQETLRGSPGRRAVR